MVLKRRFIFLCALALALAALPGRAEADPSAYIRLHVIAADDTDGAQALKLEVRDAVLDCVRPLIADCASADEAWDVVNGHIGTLRDAALRRVRACGFEDEVDCEAGVFAFPDREYGGVTVPAGDYRALRVVIGAGEGRNWWCVLYPSLCYPGDVSPEEPVVFYSSFWRWIRQFFGGEAA